MERIVVGVDGSEPSRRALEWAIDEARVRKATVEAVHVWHSLVVAPYPYVGPKLDPYDLELAAKELLDSIVDSVDEAGLPGPVDRVLVEGPAAESLIEAAKGAQLVVVGSRGRGGFSGLLLGSVSQQVVHHAPCPVVVVRPTQ